MVGRDCRAALRVAPMLSTALGPRGGGVGKAGRDIVLPTFRGMAAPWVAGTWPTRGAEVSAATASARAADVRAVRAEIWAAVSADVTALEGRERFKTQSTDLVISELWPPGPPQWATDNWLKLKQTLLRTGDNWEVWTDWYEARLNGGPANEALELARVQIAEEIWDKGPKVVNAHIKKLIEQYTPQRIEGVITSNLMAVADTNGDEPKLLSQRPAAFRFAVHAARIEATPQQEMPPDEALASDIYSELKSKVRDLIDQLQQSNSARRVVQTAQRLLDCLGANLGDVKPGVLLMRHRSLEADAAAYDTVEGRQQLFPDAIAIMHDLIASTDDLMGVYASIRNIQAAALALELQRSDVNAVQARLEEIRLAAAESEIVASSSRIALATALPDVEEITRTIESAHDDIIRAAAIEKRAQIVSLQVLDYRNFVSAVVQPLAGAGNGLRRLGSGVSHVAGKSLKEAVDAIPRGVSAGVEESVKGLIKGGIAALVGSIFGTVAGLAVLVASLRPLARKTGEVKSALENKPAPEGESKSEAEEPVEY